MFSNLVPPVVVLPVTEAESIKTPGIYYLVNTADIDKDQKQHLEHFIPQHLGHHLSDCKPPLPVVHATERNIGFTLHDVVESQELVPILNSLSVNALLEKQGHLYLSGTIVHCPTLYGLIDFDSTPITLADIVALQLIIRHFIKSLDIDVTWEQINYKTSIDYYFKTLQALEHMMVSRDIVTSLSVSSGELPFKTFAYKINTKVVKFSTENVNEISAVLDSLYKTNVVKFEKKNEITN